MYLQQGQPWQASTLVPAGFVGIRHAVSLRSLPASLLNHELWVPAVNILIITEHNLS